MTWGAGPRPDRPDPLPVWRLLPRTPGVAGSASSWSTERHLQAMWRSCTVPAWTCLSGEYFMPPRPPRGCAIRLRPRPAARRRMTVRQGRRQGGPLRPGMLGPSASSASPSKDRTVRLYPAADRGRTVAAPLVGKLHFVQVGGFASGVTERWGLPLLYTTSGFRTERSGRSVTRVFSVVYRTVPEAVYSFMHNLGSD